MTSITRSPQTGHYVYDAAAGTIRFGNNEAGLGAAASPWNRIFGSWRLQAGGGVRGNVKDGLVTGFTAEPMA